MNNLPLTPGATIDNAISEGEDYELLFATSPRERNRLEREWKKRFPRLPLTRIGSLSQFSTKDNQLFPRGYVHFQQSG
jgi:thiamine-monophosphate kinase